MPISESDKLGSFTTPNVAGANFCSTPYIRVTLNPFEINSPLFQLEMSPFTTATGRQLNTVMYENME